MKLFSIVIIIILLTGCADMYDKYRIDEAFNEVDSDMQSDHIMDSAIHKKYVIIQYCSKMDPKGMVRIMSASESAIYYSDTMVEQIEHLKEVVALTKSKMEFNQTANDDKNPDKTLKRQAIDYNKNMVHELLMQISNYRKKMIALLSKFGWSNQKKDTSLIEIGLLFPAKYLANKDETQSWEEHNFKDTPLLADEVMLTKLEKDVRRTELSFVNYFYSQ